MSPASPDPKASVAADAASLLQVIVHSTDGIVIVDHNGVVRFANPAAGSILGRPAAALLGEPFGFPVMEGRVTEIGLQAGSGASPAAAEMRVAATVWLGENAYIVTLRDITRLKQTTQGLVAANQRLKELEEVDRLKTQFVSNVSHELRTPLTVIISGANNLLGDVFGELAPDQRKWVKKMHGHAERLYDLVSDIMDLSKLESGEESMNAESMDVGELIRAVVSGLQAIAEPKKIVLAGEAPEGLPKVWAGRRRLEQVLVNLVTNAIKFTPIGGEVRVWAQAPSGCVEVTVSDTGPGVSPENRELIFERFKQLQTAGQAPTKGIGLGLAICREIIHQHKGRIWVEGGPGSNFIFRIPLDFRAGGVSESAKSILIVDDDMIVCDLLRAILERKGYRLTQINDGRKAIAYVTDPSHRFDLVFLDLMMPGADGREVLQSLRACGRTAKVIVMTAFPKSNISKHFAEQNVTMMPKPFHIDEMERTVDRLLSEGSGA
ncbi:MAG: response regulator [Elusimicrobia bacterium]|nr:response regulator [Elusimicrobiota bacterium]